MTPVQSCDCGTDSNSMGDLWGLADLRLCNGAFMGVPIDMCFEFNFERGNYKFWFIAASRLTRWRIHE